MILGSDYQTDTFDGGTGSDWFAFSFGGNSTDVTMIINAHKAQTLKTLPVVQ